MSNFAGKKSFSKSKSAAASLVGADKAPSAASESGETKPTHYLYVGKKNEQTGEFEKEFINGVFVWEKTTQYGSILKMRIHEDTSLTPGSEVYIAKRRDAN